MACGIAYKKALEEPSNIRKGDNAYEQKTDELVTCPRCLCDMLLFIEFVVLFSLFDFISFFMHGTPSAKAASQGAVKNFAT